MIEKRYPRKLNKSIDSRLLGPDEMSDAININTSEDTRGGGGNAGVIKPLKSNTPLNEGFASFSDGNKTVVGKVMCDKYDVIYFFVYDADGQNGIYAYDPEKYLPGSNGKNGITKVFSSPSLTYGPEVFIKADITYVQRNYETADGTLYEDVPYIFFTDNVSQPKKINVLRAIEQDYDEGSIFDFMLVCPRTPQKPIVPISGSSSGGWDNETDFNSNEFIGIEGFQFAYQNVYVDGSETAISAYSQIFVPPGYLRYTGSSDVAYLNQLNAIEIVIPNDDMSDEIESVKLLARRGDGGSWFFIEEFDYEGEPIEYRFLNTSVNSAISNDVQIKQFDDVPVRAESQAIIGNTLLYGNYVNGFDSVDLDSEMTPVPSERPEDFKSYELTVYPSTAPSPAPYEGGAQEKNIGFTIDASNLDAEIEQGSFISFSFTVNPKQNFHVYRAKNSYHQSPQMGEDFDNESVNQNGIGNLDGWNDPEHPNVNTSLGPNSITGHPQGLFWQSSEKSGTDFIKEQFSTYTKIPAVCSDGVGVTFDDEGNAAFANKFQWRYFDMFSQSSGIGEIDDVDFGTSAANPLIVEGKPFTVRCSFTAAADLNRKKVVEAISLILSGAEPSRDPNNLNDIDYLAENISYPQDQELEYTINLGLDNGSSFRETSSFANLITMVGKKFSPQAVSNGLAVGQLNTSGLPSGRFFGPQDESIQADIIKGFFILNKATVKFGIFKDDGYTEERDFEIGQYDVNQPKTVAESNDKPRARFGVYIKSIDVPVDEEAILSCIRRPLPGARWWCFAPWNAAGNDNTPAVTESVLFGNADFREYSLFPFTSPDNGNDQGGLQVNPGFSLAMSHNVDGYSQTSIDEGFDSGDYQNGFFDHPVRNLEVTKAEASVFRKLPEENNWDPPWKTVLGGLFYSPQYVSQQNSNQREVRFFDGEAPDGTPFFSLMDGMGGPGGRGVDGNSFYDNIVFPSLYGQNDEDYGLGIGSVGSATLMGVRVYEEAVNIKKAAIGIMGPAITNNILFLKTYEGEEFAAYPNTWRRRSTVLITNEAGDEVEITEADAQTNFNSGQPLLATTSMPYIHLRLSQGGSPDPNFTNDRCWYGYGSSYFDDFPTESNPSGYKKRLSNSDGVNALMSVIPPGIGGGQTFKAGANHAFGVVFYDGRGRASNVNPIGSVYVPWFNDRSEGYEGKVSEISCTLTGTPPEGATKYRYVYSGNTTMSRFVQYSVGGAFVSKSDDDQFSGNIYVSLNHLQADKASFAKSYGARGLDGSQDIYTFREGDRLRIVSYYENPESSSRVFVGDDYEFNIVDQVVLSTGDDNPLYDVDFDENVPHKAKTGSFLVLENNLNALGFTYDQVALGEGDPDSNVHKWNKRCVVEIYSPKLSVDEERLVYYEIGDVYSVADDFGTAQTITGGDCWWKTSPVNFQRVQNGLFKSIIKQNSSSPNFFPYNIEAQSFSEKVRNSDVWSKGRPKIVLPDEERSVKSSSIIYSDKDNPLSKIFSMTSFNPAKAQFKDLPPEFGDINYMINNDDSIFVIQSNRCSSIPVNRNLITDGGGAETLVAARQVLGTERYYAGNYGCDNNPESVCNIGNTVYFASKSNRQVYKFNPSNGVQVISDANMKSYFKKLFEQAEADRDAGQGEIKVVGGYDPYNDTYILSVYNQNTQEGTCGDNSFEGAGPVDEGDTGEPGTTETVIEYVYPDSVTIDLSEILSRFSAEQLFDLAAGPGQIDDPQLNYNINDGSISTGDLLRFLAVFGNTFYPADDQQTFLDASDGVTFNFPEQ